MDLCWTSLIRWSFHGLLINPCSPSQTHNFVSAGNFAGGREVGLAFANNGRQSCLYVGMHPGISLSCDTKFQGMVRGWMEMAKSLSDAHYLTVNNPSGISPAETKKFIEVLDSVKNTWAIFCAGDILASDLMRAALEADFKVPEDCAVVGSTRLLLAQHTTPKLTNAGATHGGNGASCGNHVAGNASFWTTKAARPIYPCSLVYRRCFPRVKAAN